MADHDAEHDALAGLLAGPIVSVAAESRALESVVARARRRVQRRRLAIAGTLVVVAAMVVTLVAIRHQGGVQVQTSNHLSAGDVTFAIFDRPSRPSDALPDVYHGNIPIDPTIGSRLAISTAGAKVYVYAALPFCSGFSAPAPGRHLPGGHQGVRRAILRGLPERHELRGELRLGRGVCHSRSGDR